MFKKILKRVKTVAEFGWKALKTAAEAVYLGVAVATGLILGGIIGGSIFGIVGAIPALVMAGVGALAGGAVGAFLAPLVLPVGVVGVGAVVAVCALAGVGGMDYHGELSSIFSKWKRRWFSGNAKSNDYQDRPSLVATSKKNLTNLTRLTRRFHPQANRLKSPALDQSGRRQPRNHRFDAKL